MSNSASNIVNATFILFSLIFNVLIGQDTIYFNENEKQIELKEFAKSYTVISKNPTNDSAIEESYFMSGKMKSQISFRPYKHRVKNGMSKEWYANGNLKSEITYLNNEYDNEFKLFYENGQIKRLDKYKKGIFIKGKVWNEDGKKGKYFLFAIKPTFPCGEEGLYRYLSKNVKYPEEAKKNNIQGIVHIEFVVEKDGTISNIEVKENPNELLKAVALEAIKNMPKWNPGYIDGEPVAVQYSVPVKFFKRN